MTQQPWGQQPQQPWGGSAPGIPQDDDPFGEREKIPSISFETAPNGTPIQAPYTYTLEVLEAPQTVQRRDMAKQPEYWPDGKPKLDVVTKVRVDGEERSLWAKLWRVTKGHKPGTPTTLFQAIVDAQAAAGARIAPGGKLEIHLHSVMAPENPGFKGRKLFLARYTPGVYATGSDPFGAPSDFAQPAQAAAQPMVYAHPTGQAVDPAVQAAQRAAAAVRQPPQAPPAEAYEPPPF